MDGCVDHVPPRAKRGAFGLRGKVDDRRNPDPRGRPREAVRAEFYKTCVAHADGSDEKQDTRRRRFVRAVERAQILNLIGVRVEPSGRTLVWLAEAQAYAG